MTNPTQERFSLIFLFTLMVSYLLFGGVNLVFMYVSAEKAAQTHIEEDTKLEFVPLYLKGDFATLNNMIEDEYYQVLNTNGDVIFEVASMVKHRPDLNKEHLDKALRGNKAFETINDGELLHMVGYLPLDAEHVARVTLEMKRAQDTTRSYIKNLLIISPFFLLTVLLISLYLVRQVFKPIVAMTKYQESFSSNISHELNSPLTAIKGNLEVTLKKDRSLSEYKTTLRGSLKSINRVIELLQNLHLLSMSKFKAADLYMKSNDFGTLIHQVLEQYEPPLYAKELRLDTSIPVGIDCLCDYGLIKRVVENIISNAIKYSLHGEVLQVQLQRDVNKNILTVINTGQPIDNKQSSMFFEPFYRGKEPGKLREDGKGLGLFISRYIVESHGGTLTMEHEDGLFTVTVVLPRKSGQKS